MICSIQNLSFGYDDNIILDDITVNVNEGDRIALIGANGTGKTTLLKLITREYTPTCGEVFNKTGLSVGYLAQNSGLDSHLTVIEELNSVFEGIAAAFSRLDEIYIALGEAAADSRAFKDLAAEQHKIEAYIAANDGYNTSVKIKTVLNGFGFVGDEEKNVSVMSGGEKTRLAFMKLLLVEPELLILDEPTNHLDYDTLAFLEKYLQNYKGTILMVSHDRYFIDALCNRIWDLEGLTVTEYAANYTKYKLLKAEHIEYMTREYEKQNIKVEAMLDYARRNIARATTSKSARSRLKQIDNMDMIEKPRTFVKPPKFHFETTIQSAKEVLNIKNYTLKIGERTLASDINIRVARGERLAILGRNGTGKSTIIRKLIEISRDTLSQLDVMAPIRFGVNTSVSYYDQENKNIDPDSTVLEALWNEYHLMNQTQIRQILAQMQLDEGDMGKKVSVLSGGERAKLAYSLIIAAKANLLILDEPTNHIDLMTREALEDALYDFDGTLIFVSHDRYFVKKLATKIAEFNNQSITVYEEGYENYLAAKEKANNPPPTSQASDEKKQLKNVNKTKKNVSKLKADIKKAENEIAELEQEEIKFQQKVADFVDFDSYTQSNAQLEIVSKKLAARYAEWEKLTEELENP